MDKTIKFAIRNEHVEELPLYPYLTDDVWVVAENFSKKYGYTPNYVYVMKDSPGHMYVVARPNYEGDDKEVQSILLLLHEPPKQG